MPDSFFSGKKVLIVGGAGFIGSNLAIQILKTDLSDLFIVDNFLSSNPENIPIDPRIRFILGSIADDAVLAQLPDDLQVVFHLACYHGNQSSIANPLADHDNNTLTSLKLFDWLKNRAALQKVVYAAAACAVAEKTYGEAEATTEDQPVTLYHDSPYSISKIIGELYGNYFYRRYKLPFVKARFSNAYGPREILGAGQWRGTPHTVWRNVIPTFIWRSLNKESLPLDNGGETTRDFIFVEDMARGLMAAAQNGQPGEVYNLATGRETSILHLATLINKITGNPTPCELKPRRDWDASGKRFASTQKAERELGFTAATTIEDGLQKTVEWTIENAAVIQRSIDQHRAFMTDSA
jgi:nucleoside-diphosphate-sugar epimerase